MGNQMSRDDDVTYRHVTPKGQVVTTFTPIP